MPVGVSTTYRLSPLPTRKRFNSSRGSTSPTEVPTLVSLTVVPMTASMNRESFDASYNMGHPGMAAWLFVSLPA
jgi:hypothetical protein